MSKTTTQPASAQLPNTTQPVSVQPPNPKEVMALLKGFEERGEWEKIVDFTAGLVEFGRQLGMGKEPSLNVGDFFHIHPAKG